MFTVAKLQIKYTKVRKPVMKYTDFEKQVVDTFNRMHYTESCDDLYIEGGYEYDVCSIISKSFSDIFHITGHSVSREELTRLFNEDEDMFLLEALQSFNNILDKYNVVPHDIKKLNITGLQVI
jgi:hypothetical protein